MPVLVALAIGVGCGGGGEESTAPPSPAATGAAPGAPQKLERHNEEVQREYQRRRSEAAPTTGERDAKRVVASFYAILAADRAAKKPNRTSIESGSFCDLMSEEAREQTVHYAEAASGIEQEWDCETAVELLVLRSKRSGSFGQAQRAEVIAINAQGDRATATVKFGDGPVTSLPLVKEDGEWKLAATPAG